LSLTKDDLIRANSFLFNYFISTILFLVVSGYILSIYN
jgi:hypothetical protein